jgi:hypothetical protein
MHQTDVTRCPSIETTNGINAWLEVSFDGGVTWWPARDGRPYDSHDRYRVGYEAPAVGVISVTVPR